MRLSEPRNLNVQIRLTSPELNDLEAFCKEFRIEKSTLIRESLFHSMKLQRIEANKQLIFPFYPPTANVPAIENVPPTHNPTVFYPI